MFQALKAKRKELEKESGTLSVEIQKYSLEARRLRRQLNEVTETKDNLAAQLDELKEAQSKLMVTVQLHGLRL